MLKPVDMFGLVRGVSQSTPAHLPEDVPHWWSSFNARFRKGRIEQTTALETFLTLDTATRVTALLGSNLKEIALSTDGLHTLDFSNLSGSLVAQPVGFSPDTTGRFRWAAVATTSGFYYTNPITPVIFFDSVTCEWNYNSSGPDYKGKYLKNFYNHLVIANVEDGSGAYPLRIAYSQIGEFDVFDPTISNEADFYDILENEWNSIYGLGITGLQQVGDVLVIFTPGSIWNMRYVGFDNGVMQFHEQIKGIGNWLPYATAALGTYAVFVSNEDFYVYDGSVIQPIGAPVRERFFSTLSEDPDLRNKTWCHLELLQQEIRWYYVSTASEDGECDMCVVFNWQTKDWYFEDGQRVSAALNAGGTTNRVINQLDLLEAHIDDLDNDSETIDGLDLVVSWPRSIYATAGGFLKSELNGEGNIDLPVILESRDIFIGDRQNISELDTIVIEGDTIRAEANGGTKEKTRLNFSTIGGAALNSGFVIYGEDNVAYGVWFSDPSIPGNSQPDLSEFGASVYIEVVYDSTNPTDYGALFTALSTALAGLFNLTGPIAIHIEALTIGERTDADKGTTFLTAPTGFYIPVQGTTIENPTGWEVQVSVRNYIFAPVEWTSYGVWAGTESELRFTGLRLSGRYFRFQFLSANLTQSDFHGFAPNFHVGSTEN